MRRRISLLPLASATAGVVLAHAVAYGLASPELAGRVNVLHAGHGYWHHATDFGVIAGALAVLGAAARGLVPVRPTGGGVLRSLPALAVWQICVFTCLESAERVAAGHAVGELLHQPAFLVGMGLQVVTALFMLLVLTGVERAVSAVVRSRRAPPIRPAPAPRCSMVEFPLTRVGRSVAQPRGPPCLRT